MVLAIMYNLFSKALARLVIFPVLARHGLEWFRSSSTRSVGPFTPQLAYTFAFPPSSLWGEEESMSRPSFDTPFAVCQSDAFVRLFLPLFFLEGSISKLSFDITFVV